MNRRTARQNVFIALFSSSFGEDMQDVVAAAQEEGAEAPLDEYGAALLQAYTAHAVEVDQKIESKLKGWKVSRLSRVSLAILRLAVTEMFYSQSDMDSVAINEAVELAKRYGDEGDYQFVNGVLGSLSRERNGAAGAGVSMPGLSPVVGSASENSRAESSATLPVSPPVAQTAATVEEATSDEKTTGPPEQAGE